MRVDRLSSADILDRSIPEPNTGCWLWLMCVGKDGYGLVKVSGKACGAHRVSYETHKGEIPVGMCVCHACDQRSCVNPDHLWLGTVQDNNTDKKLKHRGYIWHGRRGGAGNPGAKLILEAVSRIRTAKGTASAEKVGRQFGVSCTTIRNIWVGVSWKEASGPLTGKVDWSVARKEGDGE